MYHSVMSRIPFGWGRPTPGTSAISRWMGQADSRNQRDIAEGSAAEIRHHATPRPGRAARFPLQVDQFLFGERSVFFQVVGRVEVVFVNRLLADDGVEEITAVGHAGARRIPAVAQ